MADAPSIDELRAAALSYAERGWKVLPVQQGGKVPATEHGVKDATTDAETIKRWWSVTPFNIGVACGPDSGIFVVDIDPRNGGTRPHFIEEDQPQIASTGGGGCHLYYDWPQGAKKLRAAYATGVDVKGVGGFVVAPPSITEKPYRWVTDPGSGPAPSSLLAAIAIVEGAQPVDQRPGDRFNEEHTWAELLEPYGWRQSFENSEGLTYWVRPGKQDGTSATTGIRDSGAGDGEPADLLYIFSTNAGLEPEVGFDKFGFYAEMEHGGDIVAAARALGFGDSRRFRGSVPSLPAEVEQRVDASPPAAPSAAYQAPLPADHLLSRYVQYGAMLTDASPEYQEAACLAILSTLTAGVRIELAPFPDGLATNLFVALIGPTSRSRKSTVQGTAARVVRDIVPESVLPDRMTGEAMIQYLANHSSKAALWLPDELGVKISELYTRSGFLAAMEEVLLTLYSGQRYEYATMAGSNVIDGVHFVIFGASTAESFAGVGNRAIASGLLPRFGVVYPATLPDSRPLRGSHEAYKRFREELIAGFRGVLTLASYPGGNRSVTFDDAALAVLGEADGEFAVTPLTSRLSVSAYKVSALLALADLKWVVTPEYAEAALAVTRRWADGAKRLRQFLGRSTREAQFAEMLDITREIIRNTPEITIVAGRRRLRQADIARALGVEFRTLVRIRETLMASYEIQHVSENGEDWWDTSL